MRVGDYATSVWKGESITGLVRWVSAGWATIAAADGRWRIVPVDSCDVIEGWA